MTNVAARLREGTETLYGGAMLVIGAIGWLIIVATVLGIYASGVPALMAVTGVYIFYGLAIWLFFFISSIFYRAYAFGNMLMLSPEQFPELHEMVVSASQKIGLKRVPTAFIYNSNGLFNAFARRILASDLVFLTSALVEASDDNQIRFVVGHEIGHHAAGHLNGFATFIRAPAYAVPFLAPAYSRAREYTCDSIGAHLSDDFEASRSALQMLGCGCRRLNARMNTAAFVKQEALVPPISGFLSEICRTHPRLTLRVAAIRRSYEKAER